MKMAIGHSTRVIPSVQAYRQIYIAVSIFTTDMAFLNRTQCLPFLSTQDITYRQSIKHSVKEVTNLTLHYKYPYSH